MGRWLVVSESGDVLGTNTDHPHHRTQSHRDNTTANTSHNISTTATAAERRTLAIIMITLLAIAGVLGSSLGSVEAANSVTIDLSKAMLDEESGNYCVIQKVGGRSLDKKGETDIDN